MINPKLLMGMVWILLMPGATALSFVEDFETGTAGLNPENTWYSYTESSDLGFIGNGAPIIGGTQSMKFQTTGSGSAAFTLAGPTQLTALDFSVHGITITDDGVGSKQLIQVASTSPTRVLTEFYLFCADAANPSGCELRVRFDHIDTSGQVLINTSVGDQEFDISIVPNWNAGTYDLEVDGVPDGTFPFLELPQSIGQVRAQTVSGSEPMNMVFDDLFIDGATDAVVSSGSDIANGFKNWATAVHFTSAGSLFLLGLVFLAILSFAVALPLIVLGMDNTVLPALAFFEVLAVMWLVVMEWWPEWIGIVMIIGVAALLALIMRTMIMGIKDASTNAGVVAGALGYFIIATTLLGFSGYATESVEIPTSSLETPDDVEAQINATVPQQSFVGAVAECVITFFSDCSQSTVSQTWATITDVASTIFNFARSAFTFLFQLLTFNLPVSPIWNAMIVLPPAAALATVGFSFITRSGS